MDDQIIDLKNKSEEEKNAELAKVSQTILDMMDNEEKSLDDDQ